MFHFNGAGAITPYTGVLTTDAIDQLQWDQKNHLYALSPGAGRLHVYTITATGYSEAPGSPYAIAGANGLSPNGLIVVPVL